MQRQPISTVTWALIVAGLSCWLFWPVLWLELELTDGAAIRHVIRMRTATEEAFAVRFIHSVELHPVTEYFVLDDDGSVVLTGTRYKGFGAGLPTDAGEGTFFRDGDVFIIEGWRRKVGDLRIRLSPANEYAVIHRNKEHRWPDAASGARLTVRGVRSGRLTTALTKLVERSR